MQRQDSLERSQSQTIDRLRMLSSRYLKTDTGSFVEITGDDDDDTNQVAMTMTMKTPKTNSSSSVPSGATMTGTKTMDDVPWLLKVASEDEGAWGTYACSQLHMLAALTPENNVQLVAHHNAAKVFADLLVRDTKKSASSRHYFPATTPHICSALSQFTQAKENRERMVRDGVAVALVGILRQCMGLDEEGIVSSSGQTTESLQNNICGVLFNLCMEEANRAPIAKTNNLLRVVCDVMISQSQQGSPAREHSARTLWALSANTEAQDMLTQQKAVCETCLTIAMTDPHSRMICLSTVRNMTAKPANSMILVTQFPTLLTIAQLVQSLCCGDTRGQDQVQAVVMASTIVYQLASSKDCHSKFLLELPTVLPTVLLVLRTEWVVEAHQKAMGIVYQLCASNDEIRKQLVATEMQPTLINTICPHLSVTVTQQLSTASLYFLSSYPPCRPQIAAPAILASFASALPIADPKPALYICATIAHLAMDDPVLTLQIVDTPNLLVSVAGVTTRAYSQAQQAPWVRSNADAMQAVERACGALYMVSKEKEARNALFVTDGILSAVLLAIEQGSEKSKEYACAVLWCLAESSGTELQALLPAVELLASVIQTQGPGKTREAALTVIQNLCLSTSIQRELISRGVVKVLLYVLQSDTGKSQDLASGALNSLCSCEPMIRHVVVNDNVIPAMIGVLDSQTSSDITKMNTVAGLCVLLLDKDNMHELMTKYNCVRYILKSLDHITHVDFKVTLCSALQHIAHDDNLKEQLYKEPGLMTTLLRIASEPSSLARDDCIRAICFLAFSEDNRERMLNEHPVLATLVPALTDPSPQAQAYAAGTLWGLSLSPENRTTLGDHPGLVEGLVSAITSAPTAEEKVVKYACLTLKYLAMAEENRMFLVDLGVVGAMRHVLVVAKKPPVIESACATLRHLAASEETHNAMLDGADIVQPLMEVMSKSKGGKARELAGTVLLMLKKVDVVAKATVEQEQRQLLKQEREREKQQDTTAPPQPATETDASVEQAPLAVTVPEKPKKKSEEDELVAKEDYKHSTRVMQEFVDSERVYVTGLKRVLEDFQQPLLKLKNAKALHIPDLFQDLPSIFATHSQLHERMQNATKQERSHWPRLYAKILLEMSPYLKQSSPFIDKFDMVMDLLDKVTKDKKAVKVLQDVKAPLDLRSYMITPVQRLPRLVLLLKDLINHTEEDDEAYEMLIEAMASLQEVASHCNERKREADSRYKQCAIALRVRGLPEGMNLLESTRKYIYDGRIMIPANPTRLYPVSFVLFSDLILWTQENARGDQQTYKGHMMLIPKHSQCVDKLGAEQLAKLKFYVPSVLKDQGFSLELGVMLTTERELLLFPQSVLAKTHFLTHLKLVPAFTK